MLGYYAIIKFIGSGLLCAPWGGASSYNLSKLNNKVTESVFLIARNAVGLEIEHDTDEFDLCTGILLTESLILTAAHCLVDRQAHPFKAVQKIIKVHNTQHKKGYIFYKENYTIYFPQAFGKYPGPYIYDMDILGRDIALIKLKQPMTIHGFSINNLLNFINMDEVHLDKFIFNPHYVFYAIGWGSQEKFQYVRRSTKVSKIPGVSYPQVLRADTVDNAQQPWKIYTHSTSLDTYQALDPYVHRELESLEVSNTNLIKVHYLNLDATDAVGKLEVEEGDSGAPLLSCLRMDSGDAVKCNIIGVTYGGNSDAMSVTTTANPYFADLLGEAGY